MKKFNYISLEKARILEEGFGWVSNLTQSNDVIHVMTNSENSEDWNIEKTNLLHELQILNKRKTEILQKILD